MSAFLMAIRPVPDEFDRKARFEMTCSHRHPDRIWIRLQLRQGWGKLKWWRTYFETSSIEHPFRDTPGNFGDWVLEREADLLERARLALL